MGTMHDLPDALRAAGLTVWVAPDWKTNGHGYNLIEPFGGVLHHTAGFGLRSVYGEPDARPDVPQPRCNLWTPRPGTQPYDIAVICAGRAWQAGKGRMQAYDDLRAGQFTVRTPDAAARWGPDSDDIDGGWTSLHTLGNEVESLGTVGIVYPEQQLDVVAVAMQVCVDLFDWPGLGCWAHHRQLTARKPDMSYRGDMWTRAANLANPQEDDVSYEDAYNGTKAALKDVLHIDDMAIPAGQQSNNKLALALFGRTGDIKAAVDAVAALVRADESTDTQATSAIVGKLDEVKALLTPPDPEPEPEPTPGA